MSNYKFENTVIMLCAISFYVTIQN